MGAEGVLRVPGGGKGGAWYRRWRETGVLRTPGGKKQGVIRNPDGGEDKGCSDLQVEERQGAQNPGWGQDRGINRVQEKE